MLLVKLFSYKICLTEKEITENSEIYIKYNLNAPQIFYNHCMGLIQSPFEIV